MKCNIDRRQTSEPLISLPNKIVVESKIISSYLYSSCIDMSILYIFGDS